MKDPTHKQLEAIKGIHTILGITFNGKTRQEAFLFIRDNIDKARKKAVSIKTLDVKKMNRDMAHVEFFNNASPQQRYDTKNGFDIPDNLFDLVDNGGKQ